MLLFHEYVIARTLAQFGIYSRVESGDLGFNFANKNTKNSKLCFFCVGTLEISQGPVDGGHERQVSAAGRKNWIKPHKCDYLPISVQVPVAVDVAAIISWGFMESSPQHPLGEQIVRHNFLTQMLCFVRWQQIDQESDAEVQQFLINVTSALWHQK